MGERYESIEAGLMIDCLRTCAANRGGKAERDSGKFVSLHTTEKEKTALANECSYSRIQTWALEEARRRLEAEGVLEDPDKKN